MAEKWKVKKGDKVVVIAGRDKGKKGEVLRVLREENRVIVQGVEDEDAVAGRVARDLPLLLVRERPLVREHQPANHCCP